MAAPTDRRRTLASGGGDLSSQLPRAFAALLVLYYAAVILSHQQPPYLSDFADWIYSGALLARHLHGLPDPSHALKHYPVPNSTLTVLLGVLSAIVPWQMAAKLYLVLHLGICFAAIRSLARALDSSPLIWCVAPSAFFLSIDFWWGLFAFQLGVAFLFFFTAVLVRQLDSTAESRALPWQLGILLTLIFFTHMVPFTFACMLLVFFVLQTGRRRALVALVPSAILLVAYIAGRMHYGNVDATVAPTTAPHLLDPMFWIAKVNTFIKSFGFVNPSQSNLPPRSVALALLGTPVFALLFAVNLLVCAGLAAMYWNRAISSRPHRYAFAWLAVALALGVYLIVPPSLLGISDPGGRILQCSLWLALFFCMRDSTVPQVVPRTVAAGSVLLAVVGAALLTVVPWGSRLPDSDALPAPLSLLSAAPFKVRARTIWDLSRGDYTDQVFPTGLFVNLPSSVNVYADKMPAPVGAGILNKQ